MPDRRRHRGPHPEDERLFCAAALTRLRTATADLSWLLTRGYASKSALKLVGDRYRLDERQRVAVARCACSDAQARRRRHHERRAAELRGRELWVDGFNVLTSMEAAFAGGVILRARDGTYRDMASMHGSYRKVEETVPAIRVLGESLAPYGLTACRWLLDQPVSNSGRLAAMLREAAEAHGWTWTAEVVADPDPVLMRSPHPVATSDSHVLDHAGGWFNLAGAAIRRAAPGAWLVDLSTGEGGGEQLDERDEETG